MPLRVYRNANAFEYSVTRTCERLKKALFMVSRYINSVVGAVFLQEFEKFFILFTDQRLFECFSGLSTVITLEILDFYTIFQKS